MTTIEEAREAAMRQLSRAIPTKKGDNDRPYYLCEKAVDAYAAARALAVLDEAVISANLLLVKVAGEDPIMSGHTLRARIEELGK